MRLLQGYKSFGSSGSFRWSWILAVFPNSRDSSVFSQHSSEELQDLSGHLEDMENFRLPIELHHAHTRYPCKIRQTTSRYLLQAEQSASIGLSGITHPDTGFPSLTTMPVIEYTLRPCRFNNSRLCRTYCFLIYLMSSIRLSYSDCKKCALCTCSV